MPEYKVIQKIGRILFALFASGLVQAAEVQFTAEVDSPRIDANETVSLKMTIRAESSVRVGDPEFTAPDFRVAGEFRSVSVNSYYDSSSGKFRSVSTQQMTRLLKPMKPGTLRISRIQIEAGGKIYKASDIAIQVAKSGAQPPALPPGYPNLGPGQNLRQNIGSQPQHRKQKTVGTNALLKAETDKTTYYKGEQVIVSYYLYHQMRTFNLQVEKFPVLNGFLREDLEVPVMGQRPVTDPVVLNGVPYERSLLARYAAYPLEEGKMAIDSISIKFNYYPNANNNMFEDEDPFFGFFQQMVPKVWSGMTDPLSIQVLPLPEQGRPKTFTGGVGDFNITSAVDKYEVHANEALTLTVKVEGRGNLSALQGPKEVWPPDVELFDSKGKSQPGKDGVGEKIFEYLLIPRVPGKLNLPSLEFGFFDPVKKQYYTRSTDPVEIRVLDAAPGTTLVPMNRDETQKQSQSPVKQSPDSAKLALKGLKPPSSEGQSSQGQPLWRILYWTFLMTLGGLVIFVGLDSFQKRKKSGAGSPQRRQAKNWENLQARAQGAQGATWNEVTQAYELLNEELFDALESSFAVGARSFSRIQLEELLVGEKGLAKPVWDRIVRLLEFCDMVRFASSAGAVSESAARTELSKWISEGRSLIRILEKSSP